MAVAVTVVVGFPTGAPSLACSSMTPGHSSNTATGPVPFNVNISSLDGGYLPGQTYTSDYQFIYSYMHACSCVFVAYFFN